MMLYSTKSITPEIRKKLPNVFWKFDVCERCGLDQTTCEEKDKWKNISFVRKYNMILCDECIDRKDGTWNMKIYTDRENGIKVIYTEKEK